MDVNTTDPEGSKPRVEALRVLLVEDMPSDSELMALRLEEEGIDAVCTRVETEADYLAALEQIPDLVLSDWSLPGFSGLRALELLRQRDPNLPFIIVSGSIGEEQAINALHMGADDYVLKDRLARLGVAIRRALDLARARRARCRAEEELRLAAEVFEAAAEGVIITDPDQRILRVNRAFTEITGYRPEEVIGRTPKLLQSGEHKPQLYQHMWTGIQRDGRWSGEIWNRRKDGTIYPEWLSITAVREADGAVRHYIGMFTDLSEIKQARQNIEYLSQHDILTGLPNRALFEDRVRQALQHAGRSRERVAVMLINIDRLSRVNESLGHQAGDAVLKEIADRIEQAASPRDSVARLGSDDFGFVHAGAGGQSEPIATAARLLRAVEQPIAVSGHTLMLTASIGISLHPGDADSAGELMKLADAALAHAKRSGRNRFSFFRPDMNAGAVRWLGLDSRLRHALDNGEMSLFYQPRICLASGRILGAEALLRWHSPDIGAVSPADFIPLAEDTGLIVAIGEWALATACRAAQEWPPAGGVALSVSVNASARQVLDGVLPDQVTRALRVSGLAPERLVVELTESVLMTDTDTASEQLAALHGLGIRLALDDFGSGYSSLGYLGRFPFQELKIDRSFVRGIDREPKSAAIARATLALASGLGLEVVAEGIETEAEREFLRRIGCPQGQGFLFSPPVPESELLALLGRRLPAAGGG